MTQLKSVLFPVFGSFPSVLTIGTSDKEKRDVSGKKVLFVLDGTGSMGEYVNETGECSKMVIARDVIQKVLDLRKCDYDIMVFNTKPHGLCKIDQLPMPNEGTYFTPLVSELEFRMEPGTQYCSVVFMSDGLPSEPKHDAQEAIRKIGNITREASANPVSVAIGSDADGESCALFAGNRGYNCFIKYRKNIDNIASDVSNGIDCNYHMLDNGSFIPIESDGNFYYVSDDTVGEVVRPDRKLIEKYLNLVIQKNMANVSMHELLRSLITHTSQLIENEDERKEVVQHFNGLLRSIQRAYADNGQTPGLLSAVATCYRQSSGGQV
jgi:hypothetical protein